MNIQRSRSGRSAIWRFALAAAVAMLGGTSAQAHNSSVSILSPVDGLEIVTDQTSVAVPVDGIVLHSNPGNASGATACVQVESDPRICEADCEGLGNASTCNFSISVTLGLGCHTIQASAYKGDVTDHAGASEPITVCVVPSVQTCDEKDPPAHANEYLRTNNLDEGVQKNHGAIISEIAHCMNAGRYGTCQYDYDLVEDDVEDLREGTFTSCRQ